MKAERHASSKPVELWTTPRSVSGLAFLNALASSDMAFSVVIDDGRGPRFTLGHWRRRLAREGAGLFLRAATWPLRALRRASGPSAVSVESRAREIGVPLMVLRDLNDPGSIETLGRDRPEIVLIAGTRYLNPEALSIARRWTLNYHTGILPQYRGTDAIFWALVEEGPVGFTIHEATAELDQGRIFHEEVISQGGYHDPEERYARCVERAAAILPRLLSSILDGGIEPRPAPVGGRRRRAPTPREHRVLLERLRRGRGGREE